eukprot:Blabericola_migrator_1__5166@NODE_2664_length_2482_cov_15_684058_g1669_i0_p3_GENE_NODE_2664_length_2482_cov_15_684058_g1669_i0NODE_2664_length_2482_cov_15_684058_g1669_i0_p3_ORF_typecomplete_len192_score47_47_NODE_2664_length_2482_cov_15_684058_g1669_i010691644
MRAHKRAGDRSINTWHTLPPQYRPEQSNLSSVLTLLHLQAKATISQSRPYAVNRQRQKLSGKYLRQFAAGQFSEEALADYLKVKSVRPDIAQKSGALLYGLMSSALRSPQFALALSNDDLEEDDEAIKKRSQQIRELIGFVRRSDELLNVIGDISDYVSSTDSAMDNALWAKWESWLQVSQPIFRALGFLE